MTGIFWTTEEKRILEENYWNLKKELLEEMLPKRTWEAIKICAIKLGLSRNSDLLAKSDPASLLAETPEAYYWIGFLLADGCIKDAKRLFFMLSKKDIEQVKKFAQFIHSRKINEYANSCGVSVQHSAIHTLAHKFDISNRKTYEPPDISWIDGDLLVCLFIGFIDGDGCIRQQPRRFDYALIIKCHSSWIENLDMFSRKIHQMVGLPFRKAKINSCGYAQLEISNSIVLKFLKREAIRFKLPIMERKLGLINLNKVSRQEQGNLRIDQAINLLDRGFLKKDVAEILGISAAGLSQIIKRNNIKTYKGKGGR